MGRLLALTMRNGAGLCPRRRNFATIQRAFRSPEPYPSNGPEVITRMSDTRTCHNGTRCPGWDGQHAAPTHQPYCEPCLDRHRADIGRLLYDYLDLAQLHEASLSQAPAEHTSGGGHESPTLLADHVEALQAEIVHVVGLWEHALRAALQLPNPQTWVPLWNRHVYDHIRLTDRTTTIRGARPGHIVQRATTLITTHLDRLARLDTITVCPTGIEDPPTPITGPEAVQQLAALHWRARGYLGRTVRTFWIPGECWSCPARPARDLPGPLYRSEPRAEGDPLYIHCHPCGATRPYEDYQHYQLMLLWPDQHTDKLVRTAA